MKLISTFSLLILLHIQAFGQKTILCELETPLGIIEFELYADKAPITVTNFLRYIDEGLFTNSSFYRVCTPENEAKREHKIEVIQGGNVSRGKSFKPIPLENTKQTGLKHEKGTLSMARTAEPNSARSDFFICIGDQPELDYGGNRNPDGLGFAAFGKVTKGMEIVKQIQAGENINQYLKERITILSIRRKSN